MRKCLVITLALLVSGCQWHNYAHRGAAVGGLTGGGLGAVLGEMAGDQPLAGAAIGSAMGAVAGASVGSALDDIDARSQVETISHEVPVAGLTLNEVVAMSQAGLSDDVIERQVQSQGFAQPLDTADLIALRRQGVTDRVIGSLQTANASPVPPPVIVEQHHYPPAGPWRRPRRCPPGPAMHWGVTFGH